ncbi:MAG: putative membrane protein [Kiritimatiellia bacterium]|jgi:uncharacterized membrane protein
MSEYSMINICAILWFCCVWLGYTYFAKYKAKCGLNLTSVLSRQRLNWMEQILGREHRIMDAALVANLEHNTSFLASTSILVLAGLLTALGIAGSIGSVLQSLPFYEVKENSAFWIYIKILMLILIYVYAFFALTWSMRQYGFASVMIGSAPTVEAARSNPNHKEKYMYASAKVIDMAGHAYNYGLRAYYFSLAILPWFISPWLFILSTSIVVIVLYSREFHSRPYKVIKAYMEFCDAEANAELIPLLDDEGRSAE